MYDGEQYPGEQYPGEQYPGEQYPGEVSTVSGIDGVEVSVCTREETAGNGHGLRT